MSCNSMLPNGVKPLSDQPKQPSDEENLDQQYKEETTTLGQQDAVCDQVQPNITIKVATINLFGIYESKNKKTLAILKQGLESNKPDVVVIQEAPKDILHQVENYELIYETGRTKGRGETIACLVYKQGAWKWNGQNVEYITNTCPTPRVSVVSTFVYEADTNYVIQIANVHLCGGRNDEEHVPATDGELITKKTELFELYSPKPDIVLGDFNSDANHFVDEIPAENQLVFLMQKGWNEKHASLWHKAPYQWLSNNSYSLVSPEKETSHFKNTPDTIWYKNDRLEWTKERGVIDFGAINGHGQLDGASDHNGIFAVFSVKPLPL